MMHNRRTESVKLLGVLSLMFAVGCGSSESPTVPTAPIQPQTGGENTFPTGGGSSFPQTGGLPTTDRDYGDDAIWLCRDGTYGTYSRPCPEDGGRGDPGFGDVPFLDNPIGSRQRVTLNRVEFLQAGEWANGIWYQHEIASDDWLLNLVIHNDQKSPEGIALKKFQKNHDLKNTHDVEHGISYSLECNQGAVCNSSGARPTCTFNVLKSSDPKRTAPKGYCVMTLYQNDWGKTWSER